MFHSSRIQFSGIFKDEPLAIVAGVSLVLIELVVQLLSFLTKGTDSNSMLGEAVC